MENQRSLSKTRIKMWETQLLTLRQNWETLSPPQRAKATRAARKYRELRENEAIRFFTPNGAQQRYIDAVGDPEAFIIVFSAGNGVGKTAATIAIVAAIIWPELAPQEVFGSWVYDNWPYPKDFRIISTPQEIADSGSIQREIKKWFPKGQYRAFKNGKPYDSLYKAKDFTVSIMSFDMAPEAFEGATNGIVIYNEPPPLEIHNACAARMRKGGRILFPMTPLYSAAWIKDKLVDKAKPGSKYIQVIGGDIEANCKEHGENGLLEHQDIVRLLAGYDPEELEARAQGKFMHLSGAIFKSFSRDIHVVEPHQPPDGVGIVQVVDPASGKPMSVLWAYVNGRKDLVIFDEWPDFQHHGAKDPNMTVKDYVQVFQTREGGRYIQARILDRRFGNTRHKPGEPTLKEDFATLGVDYLDSYQVDGKEEVETGINIVREYLQYDKTKPIDALNSPRLKITSNCTNTILAMERWGRDPKTGKPKEDYKDFADCVRYLCAARPEPEQPTDWGAHFQEPKYGVGNV